MHEAIVFDAFEKNFSHRDVLESQMIFSVSLVFCKDALITFVHANTEVYSCFTINIRQQRNFKCATIFSSCNKQIMVLLGYPEEIF